MCSAALLDREERTENDDAASSPLHVSVARFQHGLSIPVRGSYTRYSLLGASSCGVFFDARICLHCCDLASEQSW
eukprot:2590397-Rhodomonas_salina.2